MLGLWVGLVWGGSRVPLVWGWFRVGSELLSAGLGFVQGLLRAWLRGGLVKDWADLAMLLPIFIASANGCITNSP